MQTKYLLICSVFLIVLTGCQNNSLQRNIDEEQQIYIHNATKNYAGLIELYKNRLKSQDTAETRYKLAQIYYLSSDYDSAYRTLTPIIELPTTDEVTLVLYGRILYKLGKYSPAVDYLKKSLFLNPKNGEAYNLQGIVQIRLGQYDAAYQSFNRSKEMFYDENKVNNNLAMLAILSQDYLTAYNYLNILYNKGYRSSVLLHNLLYTLVKLDKISIANQLCIEHKLSNQPMILIQELKLIEPNKNIINFNKIVPTFDEMQKTYGQEVTSKVDVTHQSTPAGAVIQQPTINDSKKIITKDNVQNIKSPIAEISTSLSVVNANTINNLTNTTTIVNDGTPSLVTLNSPSIKNAIDIKPIDIGDDRLRVELNSEQSVNAILGNHQKFVNAIKDINLH